jgi:hypothetical protein
MAYFVKTRGFNPRNWRLRANKLIGLELVGPIAVDGARLNNACDFCHGKHRTGHLAFPDKEILTQNNAKALVEWIWVWMK